MVSDILSFVRTNDVPVIESVEPNIVTIEGGNDIIITGSNFQDGVKGVVGTITEVGLSQSKIRSLHKSGSDVGSMVGKVGYIGVTSGNNDITSLELNYIDKRAKIRKGDKVYTLNNDSIFPPEILIGEITQVYPLDREFYQKAIVEPFIRVTRIQEVFVVKRKNKNNSQSLIEK